MSLNCLRRTPEWDSPIFKVLANNDTGNARGHQGGIVIPKDLRPFFPGLTGSVSLITPTIDKRIDAQLFVENDFKGSVSTRYQYQTWGGERSPESRLTDQLGAMRNLAKGEDVLIIRRSIDRLDSYRLTLVRRDSPEFSELLPLIGSRRWGVLAVQSPPVSDSDLHYALAEESSRESAPFSLIDPSAESVVSTVKKVARSLAFRTRVLEQYDETCSVCGEALKSPNGFIEVDAAHIVPRALFGADDARNGFALCKRHHWAFDKGLFGVCEDRKICIPSSVSELPQNSTLIKFIGHSIREAKNSSLQADPGAFHWHRENVLLK